jgi:hypothetical protein
MIEINKKYHTVGTVPTYDRYNNSVEFFVNFYHMLELLQQCGMFCLSLSYVGTVPTVWYFLFISVVCWNCSNSVICFVYLYHMLELLQQFGNFCLFLSYVGTVIGTVPTYDRNKQRIPHCWNSSNIRQK